MSMEYFDSLKDRLIFSCYDAIMKAKVWFFWNLLVNLWEDVCAMEMPKTKIGDIEISRMICGSNTFHGFSHFSAARDNWLRQYFTRERTYELLEACIRLGMNAVVSGLREDFYEILQELERNTGHHMVWICTPGGRTAKELEPGIRWCADHGVEICMPHQVYTDNNLIPAQNRIDGAEEVLGLIRSLGMIPGWSTHRPETIVVSDSAGYDVEAYIQPYNSIGFLCAVETDWVAQVINRTPKPVICIKPLGAGRIMPPTGLSFVYGSIKPIDTVCIGVLSPQEAEEDARIAVSIMEKQHAEVPLQYTRSKQVLAQQKTK